MTTVNGIAVNGTCDGVHKFQVQFRSDEDAENANKVFRLGEACLNTYYGAMLDTADSALNDAIHVLRTKKKWKFQVKHDVSRAKQLSEKTCKRLRRGLKLDLYIDMLDVYQDLLKEDVDKLKEAVVQRLHKLGVEHARYKANFEVVNVLYGMAIRTYRDILEDVDRAAKACISKHYTDEINPCAVMRLWCNAMPLLVDYGDDISCEVLKDESVTKYMKAIDRRISTQRGADEALALMGYEHPEVLKEYADGVEDVSYDELMAYAEAWHKKHNKNR